MRQCLTQHLKCKRVPVHTRGSITVTHQPLPNWQLELEGWRVQLLYIYIYMSHIFKYLLGYVKVWFDNAGSHLSAMTECVLRLSILPASNPPGGVLGALCGQGQQSFPMALVGCGIPSQMPGCLPGLPCFPCCHKFGPTVQAVRKWYFQEPTLANLEQLAEEEI